MAHGLPTNVASEQASCMTKRAKRPGWEEAPAVGLEVTKAIADEMYAQMQTPGHRTAIDAAFAASPAQMGDAALAAAKRGKRQAG